MSTTAGDLPARWVIHTVGPVYDAARDQSATLRSCYARSLAIAGELDASSIAFPLISAGAYGWPRDGALRQAFTAMREADTAVEEARGSCSSAPTRTPPHSACSPRAEAQLGFAPIAQTATSQPISAIATMTPATRPRVFFDLAEAIPAQISAIRKRSAPMSAVM